jgi:DNA-binding beta-propeller fold protein YncE
VSSEYNNKVYIFNPQTLQVTDSITFPYKNTEGMCLYNGSAFICVWDTSCSKLYQVDILTNKVTREVVLPTKAPQEVMVDKEQMLWVLAGDEPYGYTASFLRIDPSSGEVLQSYQFPTTADPLKPVMNGAKDTIYFS